MDRAHPGLLVLFVGEVHFYFAGAKCFFELEKWPLFNLTAIRFIPTIKTKTIETRINITSFKMSRHTIPNNQDLPTIKCLTEKWIN